MKTGRIGGDLKILKAWESSEKDILELFLPVFIGSNPFSFIAIGSNIPFVYTFLVERARILDLDAPDPVYLFGSKPYLDIKPFLVMMNGGSFKGASLERFTEMSFRGDLIPKLFMNKDFRRIEECVIEEANEFRKLYVHLKEKAPGLIPEGIESPDRQWF